MLASNPTKTWDAITNESGIPGHAIGSIESGNKFSVVEVPRAFLHDDQRPARHGAATAR